MKDSFTDQNVWIAMMDKNSNKVKKPTHISGKKSKHKMKNTGNPPSQTESFSANWKKFLEQKKVLSDQVAQKPKGNVKNEHKAQSSTSVMSKKTDTKKNTVKIGGIKRKRNHVDENDKDLSDEIWFDVDPELIPSKVSKVSKKDKAISHTTLTNGDTSKDNQISSDKTNKEGNEPLNMNLTRYVALDCEMVGVGMEGKESILARVSIVNSHGECLYDKYVTPKEKVVDYRTHVSGISPSDLKNAVDFSVIQKEVNDLLKGRILVGHALSNDMKVLMLSHPKKHIRDTSKYKPFHKLLKTKRPALKKLALEILQQEIQTGAHNSVLDAQITMQIFKKYKKAWEKSLHTK